MSKQSDTTNAVQQTEFVAVKMEPNCEFPEYEEFTDVEDFERRDFVHYPKERPVIDILEDDSGTNWYLCNKCPFKTHNKRSLYGHLVIHNEGMFSCPHCYFKTKHKRYLKTHVSNQHSDIKWFYCDFCMFKAISKKTVQDHMLDRHTLETMRWFQCDKCQYRTQNRDDCKHHENLHLADDAVKIKREDGSFETNNQQKKSSIAHGDLYCCSQCSFTTNLKHTLKRHILCKHMDEQEIEWFGCDQCEYKTKTRNCLRIHKLNKHTSTENIKWFPCEKCPYRGKHKSHLQAHRRRHHAIKTEIIG